MVEDALARGVPPDRIGYVSFTKRAAQEASSRAAAKFKLSTSELRYFRTLHSMCFNALGLSNSDVFEGKKIVEFGHWLGVEFSLMRHSDDGLLLGYTPGDRAMFMENLARVRRTSLREQYDMFHDNIPWNFVEHVARGLRQYKQDTGLLDYTDMLEHFVASDWSPLLEELYVDEAQDLSLLQWEVVGKLGRNCRRAVVAGDDDQAIYRWAGAAVEHFVDLPGSATVLGQSYRCPPQVQQLSHEIISRVTHRRPKEWLPREAEGVVERLESFSQVDIWGKKVLILARNEFVLRPVMESIRSDGVIYEWRGHTSVSRPILDAVWAWERLRSGEHITADEARRVYEYMSSGRGVRRGFKQLPGVAPDMMVDHEWLTENGGLLRNEIWHEALDRIPDEERIYLLRARQKGESTNKPRVTVSTIHGAKGGEADHVILLRDMANRTYEEMLESPDDEARVWYVAVTRAKQKLTIVAPQTGMSYDV